MKDCGELLEARETVESIVRSGYGDHLARELAKAIVTTIDYVLEPDQEYTIETGTERPLRNLSDDDLFTKANCCVERLGFRSRASACKACGLESRFDSCYDVLLMELACRVKEQSSKIGEWKRKSGFIGWITSEYECSICKGSWVGAMNPPRYCGHCGARMKNGG